MASLHNDLLKGVYDVLSDTATLDNYPKREAASFTGDVPLPAIVFGIQDARGTRGSFTQRHWDADVLVKVVADGPSYKSAGDIEDLIDDALESATLTVTGFTHVTCTRGVDVAFAEDVPGGGVVCHVGAVWSVWEDRAI
jgi:hypothetical protein